MEIILLKTNFPFAQGVFTATLVALFVFVISLVNKGVDKTIDKAHLSSNNINKLLHLASAFLNKRKIDESLQAYKKVLTIEPVNPEALVSLVNIYFAQGNYDEAENYCEIIYNQYFNANPQSMKGMNSDLIVELHHSIYCYGYILSKKGLSVKAEELKNLSLENKEYVQEYEDSRTEKPY